MKKFLFILFVCFAAVSCNSFDDEVGYIVTTNGTYVQNVISANQTYCKIKYGHTIKEVAGSPKLSKVVFKLSGEGEEEIIDAQKGEENLYSAEFEIPYDRNVKISTIAIINGKDEIIFEHDVYYSKTNFCPNIADSICTNPLNYDVIRYFVECDNTLFKSNISKATVTIGKKTYPLTIINDNQIYCDINLYDIANYSGYPTLTIKNEVDEYKVNGHAHIEVVKEAITGYDTSKDGKDIEGCIYLAGTKWAKGVIVTGTDKKNHLDINEENGLQKISAYTWNSYLEDNNLDGYKIPSIGQADSLIHYCSIQKVKALNASNYEYVVYPAKKNEKIKSFFSNIKPTPMADIRSHGVYIKDNVKYASTNQYNTYSNPYYYYYWPESKKMLTVYTSGIWDYCLLLPIKD